MRLLKWDDSGSLAIEDFPGDSLPAYAILSHTWGPAEEEVTYDEVISAAPNLFTKPGYSKIKFCADQAAKDGLKYFWVDCCSIDKSSSAELAEAINSMFRWYRNSKRCYVYLPDVSVYNLESSFRKSRWFTRGWTLQELLAPKVVEFFSGEGLALGDRRFFASAISDITGISLEAVYGNKPLNSFPISERMDWAKGRQTTRREDEAYCLLGIFGVHLSPIYGERENAFVRLQEEINKRASNQVGGGIASSSFMLPQQRPPRESIDRGAKVEDRKIIHVLVLSPTIKKDRWMIPPEYRSWENCTVDEFSEPSAIDKLKLEEMSQKDVLDFYKSRITNPARDAVDKAIAKHREKGNNSRYEWVLVGLMDEVRSSASSKLPIQKVKVYLQRTSTK